MQSRPTRAAPLAGDSLPSGDPASIVGEPAVYVCLADAELIEQIKTVFDDNPPDSATLTPFISAPGEGDDDEACPDRNDHLRRSKPRPPTDGGKWLSDKFSVLGAIVLDGLRHTGSAIGDLAASSSLAVRHALQGRDTFDGHEQNWAFSITDSAGNPALGVRENDVHLMHVGPSVRLRLLFDDARNVARTAATFGNLHNLPIAALTAERSLFVIAGQSLSTGLEAWPPLTRQARSPMAYMIGRSVRPENGDMDGGWTPQGSIPSLTPLIATAEQSAETVRRPMKDAEIAAIDPVRSNGYLGENSIVAAVGGLSQTWATIPGAPVRKFIAACAGYGGRNIESLQDGNVTFTSTTDLLDLHKALAACDGESWNVPSLTWEQGQANYTIDGSINDKQGYKAQLGLYYANFKKHLALRGQAPPPAMFLHTTSGRWLNDALEASISMAQVEFALETPGAFVVGPSYPVTGKGGHLDSNGSRWMGVMNAKVQRRVLINRMGHEPFYPYRIEAIERYVYIHMGGAVGPVRFQPIYAAGNPATRPMTETFFPDRGFRVEDADGFLSILSVEPLAATIIAIECDRSPCVMTGRLWYADRSLHVGSGNLCDSDPAHSEEVYEYLHESGMYSAADIAALVGNPYPLWNWCTPFVLPLTYAR